MMLFAAGQCDHQPEARDALLAFLRPPRPPEFRGHCLTGHADRDPGAAALSLARVRAVAAMMLRQGVDAARHRDRGARRRAARAPGPGRPGGSR